MKSNFFKTYARTLVPKQIRSYLGQLVWDIYDIQTETASGFKLEIKSPGDWYVFNEIFVAGVYDEAIKLAIDNSPENHRLTILDMGANVGFFTFRVLDLLERSVRSDLTVEVIAVEGNPKIYKLLKERLSLLDNSRFSVNPIFGLVGKRSGNGLISQANCGPRSSVIRTDEGKTAPVPYVDLDNIINPSTPIDLVKCDIEGAEELFITNYPTLFSRTNVAVFELHDGLCDTRLCVELLEKAGLVSDESINFEEQIAMALFTRRTKSI